MKNSVFFNRLEWYKGWKRVFIHVLFWLFIFFVQSVQSSFSIKTYDELFYLYTLRNVVTVIVIHYFFTLYAIPQLIKGRILLFLLALMLTTTFMVFSMYFTFYVLVRENLVPPLLNNLAGFYIKKDFFGSLIDPLLVYNTFLFHPVLFFTILIKTTKDFFSANIQRLQLENKNIKLEKENIKLELNFLRSQIHPHFFFNTLNNIYSLVLDKDDFAANIVLRLSNLMRYSLYESNNDKISLQRELEFISDYVELEKIRHKEHVSISLETRGNPKGLEIPPLILVTFVENAFKHGVNNSIEASWVKINFNVKNGDIFFSIENSKPAKLQKESVDGGIGVMNVRRRLDLIYPDMYTLKIQNHPLKYLVNLKIQTNGKAEVRNSGRRAVSTGSN